MSSQDMFTILIPTRRRHSFLRRTLDYLASEHCLYDVIIADSTETDFEHIKYDRIIYSNFADEISYAARVLECLNRVRTPYVMILGDDDFVNLNMIPEICSFLEEHRDYVVADGLEIRIKCDETGPVKNIFHKQCCLSSDVTRNRLIAHCKDYWPTFYGVHRTSIIIKSFQIMKQNESSGYLFQELSASMATIIQGKYHNFSNLYLIRQNFHAQSTSTVWWTDMLLQDDFAQKCNLLVDTLAHLGLQFGIQKRHVRKALNQYLSKFRQQNIERSIKTLARSIVPIKIINFYKGMSKVVMTNKSETQELVPKNNAFYENTHASLSAYPFGKN